MNAAKVGEELLVDARALKIGRQLAFLECELRSKETNKIILKGSHTKFVGGGK